MKTQSNNISMPITINGLPVIEGRKVSNLQTKEAVQFDNGYLTSFQSPTTAMDKPRVEMTITLIGVLIRGKSRTKKIDLESLVPFENIKHADLVVEIDAK